jgi:hypothetical protein
MLLRVDIDGASWVADVGFGGGGLLEPLPLRNDQPVSQYAWTYRLVEEADSWVLQARAEERWEDMYAFTLERQHPVDFEVANWYVSTHPDSIFVRTITAQRPTSRARYVLRGSDLTTDLGQKRFQWQKKICSRSSGNPSVWPSHLEPASNPHRPGCRCQVKHPRALDFSPRRGSIRGTAGYSPWRWDHALGARSNEMGPPIHTPLASGGPENRKDWWFTLGGTSSKPDWPGLRD